MYCKCGTEIGIDSRWNGFINRVVFTHEGEEISECPGCGESVIAWLDCGQEQLIYRKGALLYERPNTASSPTALSATPESVLTESRGGLCPGR